MDNLSELTYKSINNYFNTLSTFGYKSYNDVNKILVLLFINDLLSNEFGIYINEDDYKTIGNVIYCLIGSTCLIPYPEFEVNTSLVQIINSSPFRETEDESLRISENELFRLLSE